MSARPAGAGRPYAVSVPKGYRVGRWEVREALASGAFGSVYAARRTPCADDKLPKGKLPEDGLSDDGLPDTAALKFLPTGTHTPRQLRHLRELAEREVDLLRRLRSPRLIRMYETLTVDDPGIPELDGATVLVLEQAEGSLDTLLTRSPTPDTGPALLAQICEGLRQLHRAGWVHGDLKPANVLLMRDGTARLADFNLAAELEGTHAYTPAFSTPDYTPPELLWSEIGERGQQIRPTADTWAFGVLAHVVLAGSLPLPGATTSARRDAAVRYARGTLELRLSPELPEAWRQIITDCLAPTHAERTARTTDTATLLRRVERAAGTPPSARPRPAHVLRRRPWATAATAVAAVAALGFGVSGTLTDSDSHSGPRASKPQATGYDRCARGDVCFFTQRDGQGEMCAWEGDDTDWVRGPHTCDWATTRHPRSVFNNGYDTDEGEELVAVLYYAENRLREQLGCLGVRKKANFAKPVAVRSHTWVEHC
ncbi:protein kinase domain-containing protein [Streptomyces apocyni]|uniref:protein kinase domain-containing protein n=1 Tax=Streptomyces apocyni TaxID=2654677 RepID=UPI0012EA10EC|nr:protein kinase [Streptomyces apocyni]